MCDIPEKLARKPEAWSHMERAVTMHNLICTDPLAYEMWKSTHPQLFGTHDMSGVAAPAWMEGFMVALAFCSGAVSGGKLREFARIINPHLDTFGLNKFAESAMASQYIWDKQEEPHRTHDGGNKRLPHVRPGSWAKFGPTPGSEEEER